MKNNHYYTPNNDTLKSNPQTYKLNIFNQTFNFKTDHGVFSKNYLDFGSYMLLKSFKPLITGEVLDVGCGYGPLGIVISKVYDKNVLMLDINERAVRLTNENIIANKTIKATAKISNIYEALAGEKYASIVTNPPIRAGKKVVYGIYDGAHQHLLPGGELWVVIQKKQGAPSTIEHLKQVFGNCEVVKKEKGYFILKSIC